MGQSKQRKNIFFVTYGGGHLSMIIPILRYLGTLPEYKIGVLGLTTAGLALKREGIPYYGMLDFVGDQDAEALEWGKRLAQEMPTEKVPQEESIAYLGLSYMDLIQRHGEKEAGRMYAELGRQAFCPVTVLERVLKKIQPDLLIATNSPRAEKAAIISAQKLNIPAICLVDLFGLWEVEWIKDPQYANKVCVLSEYVKNILARAGRNPQDIVVTGNPAFDRLAEKHLPDKSRKLRIRKHWENSKVILWCSQPEPKAHPMTGTPGDPDLPRKIETILVDIMSRHPHWRLVLRPHPNDNVQFQNLPDRVEVSSSKDDLEVLLHAIDGIVTMTSTVGLQAAMLGKPFLSVEMSVFTPDAPYSDMGIAYGVDQLTDIEEALVNILDKNWRSEIGPLKSDGKATENVVHVIQSMLNKPGQSPDRLKSLPARLPTENNRLF